MIGAWARLIVGKPAVGWAIWILISGVVIFGLSRLQFHDDPRSSFRPKTAAAIAAEELLAEFPILEDAFLVLVQGGGFFQSEKLTALEDFDFELRGIDGVKRVLSIFDARARVAVDGYYPPLMPGPSASSEELAAAAKAAIDHPGLRGIVLSDRADALLFFVDPDIPTDDREGLLRMGAEIEEAGAVLTRAADFEVGVTGVPAIHPQIVDTIMQEQVLYAAGGALLGAVIGWLLFRSVAALLLVFLVPQVASSWILGVMGLVGEPIGVLNSMVMVLVMILALANAMHMILAVCRHGAAGKSPREASVAAAVEVGPACFLTSLTTAIAFGSLVLSDNLLVVHFGVVCALGTLLMFAAVLLVVPLLSGVGWIGRSLARSPASAARVSDRYFRLGDFALRHSRVVFILGVVLLVAAILLGSRVHPDFSYQENLGDAAPGAVALAAVDEEFGGSQPLYYLVKSDAPIDQTASEALEQLLDRLNRTLSGTEFGGTPRSVWNLSRATGKSAIEALEELSPADRGSLVGGDGRTLLVTLPVRDAGGAKLIPFLRSLEGEIDALAAEFSGFDIVPAGLLVLSTFASDDIIREMAISLAAAAVLIFAVIMFALRSVVLGLISFLPNVLPLAVTLGLLVLLGEPLRYNSALALTICLGVAVDDTVHLLFRYRAARRRGEAPSPAVLEALPATGSALVNSTLILGVGLAMLLFSSLPTIRLFGLLCIVTLLVALVADLILLPAMLKIFDRRRT